MASATFRLNAANNLQPSPRRSARACGACNARKVRCDVSVERPQCSNCKRDGQQCVVRERRQRRPARRLPPVQPDQAPTINESENAVSGVESSVSTPYQHGHMERASFIGPEGLEGHDGQEPDYASHIIHGSSVARKICELQGAYELPSKAIRTALFDNFFRYCYPWDPIVEKAHLSEHSDDGVSRLLLQAVLLGGSRMSGSLPSTTPHEFYLRAKTLFYTDQERNPLNKVIAVSLLHWWNPHGPELVSTNTSTFWNRIAISLAMQMGLNSAQRRVPDESHRRRIWWTLVARDHLISAAHGRPQATNLDHCDVPRPNIQDFPPSSKIAPIFMAYVDLAVIVGKLVNENILKSPATQWPSNPVGTQLWQWLEVLPQALHLRSSEIETLDNSIVDVFAARQLLVTYYATVAMLYRMKKSDDPFPIAAVLAGSTIAGIFEDLLARDQLRHLGPVHTFYLLVASIALLSCYRFRDVWSEAQKDLAIIGLAQEEMKKKWPSAIGSIRSYEKMLSVTTSMQDRREMLPLQHLDPTARALLRDVDGTYCRLYKVVAFMDSAESNSYISDLQTPFSAASNSNSAAQNMHATTTAVDQTGTNTALENTDWTSVDPMDTWILDDSLFGGHLFWDDVPPTLAHN